jgi:hypothetical protein
VFITVFFGKVFSVIDGKAFCMKETRSTTVREWCSTVLCFLDKWVQGVFLKKTKGGYVYFDDTSTDATESVLQDGDMFMVMKPAYNPSWDDVLERNFCRKSEFSTKTITAKSSSVLEGDVVVEWSSRRWKSVLL